MNLIRDLILDKGTLRTLLPRNLFFEVGIVYSEYRLDLIANIIILCRIKVQNGFTLNTERRMGGVSRVESLRVKACVE
jgi:hypothetical protein